MNNLIIYLILSLGQILLDTSQIPCSNAMGLLLIILHHFLSIYIVFGSILLGNCKLHLCIVLLGFGLNIIGNMCPITKWHNHLCDHPPNTYLPTYLNHIMHGANIKLMRIMYMIVLVSVILYDLRCIDFHKTMMVGF